MQWVSQSSLGDTCPDVHFVQYIKAWMSSTDPVSSITNCYRLIVSYIDQYTASSPCNAQLSQLDLAFNDCSKDECRWWRSGGSWQAWWKVNTCRSLCLSLLLTICSRKTFRLFWSISLSYALSVRERERERETGVGPQLKIAIRTAETSNFLPCFIPCILTQKKKFGPKCQC